MSALKLVPGKELLRKLLIHTGCSNTNDLARAVSLHLSPEAYAHTNELKEQVGSLL